MSKHNELGKKGEQIALEFLVNKGFIILEQNYRVGQKEVDLICLDNEILVFCEIKTRSGTQFGFPEEAVSNAKQNHLKATAEYYLDQNPKYTQLRFDVVSIIISNDVVKEIVHFEDAFY